VFARAVGERIQRLSTPLLVTSDEFKSHLPAYSRRSAPPASAPNLAAPGAAVAVSSGGHTVCARCTEPPATLRAQKLLDEQPTLGAAGSERESPQRLGGKWRVDRGEVDGPNARA